VRHRRRSHCLLDGRGARRLAMTAEDQASTASMGARLGSFARFSRVRA